MDNPYPARLDELHAWLYERYGQRDRQATEILLACLLPATVTMRPRPWIVIETDWMTREFSDAWFNFGGVAGHALCLSLGGIRAMHGRVREELLTYLLSDRRLVGRAGLFVEADWRVLPHNGLGRNNKLLAPGGIYSQLIAGCVRVRVEHPKGHHALRTEDERSKERCELARLASRVLDSQMRSAASAAASARQSNSNGSSVPESLPYYCELLQQVAPAQADWETLVQSLIGIADGLAVLRNDGPADWQAAERVLRDTIPYYTYRALDTAREYQLKGRAMRAIAKRAGIGKLTTVGLREMRRLTEYNVIKDIATGDGGDWASLLDRKKRILV